MRQHGFNNVLSRAIKRGVCNIASPFHVLRIPVWVARYDRSRETEVIVRSQLPQENYTYRVGVASSMKRFFFVHFIIDLSRAIFTCVTDLVCLRG